MEYQTKFNIKSSIAKQQRHSISILFVILIILSNEFNSVYSIRATTATTESPNDPKYFVEATPFSGYNSKFHRIVFNQINFVNQIFEFYKNTTKKKKMKRERKSENILCDNFHNYNFRYIR